MEKHQIPFIAKADEYKAIAILKVRHKRNANADFFATYKEGIRKKIFQSITSIRVNKKSLE